MATRACVGDENDATLRQNQSEKFVPAVDTEALDIESNTRSH